MQRAFGNLHYKLPKALRDAPAEPRLPKPEPKEKGKKKYSDALIRAMRILHEVDRKTVLQVCEAFPDIDPTYVRQILNYTARGNVLIKTVR